MFEIKIVYYSVFTGNDINFSYIDEFSKELQKEYEGRVKATKMITDLQKDKSRQIVMILHL